MSGHVRCIIIVNHIDRDRSCMNSLLRYSFHDTISLRERFDFISENKQFAGCFNRINQIKLCFKLSFFLLVFFSRSRIFDKLTKARYLCRSRGKQEKRSMGTRHRQEKKIDQRNNNNNKREKTEKRAITNSQKNRNNVYVSISTRSEIYM